MSNNDETVTFTANAQAILDFDATSGIATITLQMEGRANKINDAFGHTLAQALGWVQAQAGVKGLVIASGHKDFCVGADLDRLYRERDPADLMERLRSLHGLFRRIEQLPFPVVAAPTGSALGGGYELALACHHRIALDDAGIQLGLPEVSLGVIPGAGGTQRLPRIIGIQAALEHIAQGKIVRAPQAKKVGMVDALAPDRAALVKAAAAWIAQNPRAKQPWDDKKFRFPGPQPGSDDARNMFMAGSAMLYKKTAGAFPAAESAMSVVQEGCAIAFDAALIVEMREFTRLATSDQAKDMIRTLWFHRTAAEKHEGLPTAKEHGFGKVGILGAGMMGAGIAYVSAKAGYDVVLKDVSLEAAERGKGYSEKLEAKALGRGRTTEEKSAELLGRITPTADAADLKGVDFVIEAVFESVELKQKVFQEIEDIVEPNAVLGSNTSTLPITGLATGVKRQEDFIGIHFFSPVDKMPLVEIIKGEKTSDEALARVFDYTLAIGKTPIVVNDSRGFFTSRVIGTFVNEALAMLGEGVAPSSIEQAGSQAGYPAPPLQLSDELNLELMHKIALATRKGVEEAGGTYEPHPAEAVVEKMIEIGRPSRLSGAGFYEYVDGKRTGLWPGLKDTFKSGSAEIPLQDMIDRMLFAEALETQKCLDEGVLTSTADANIGSIMGIGYPPYTGGSAQFIVGYQGVGGVGKDAFVARAKELAAKYGERFTPPASLTS